VDNIKIDLKEIEDEVVYSIRLAQGFCLVAGSCETVMNLGFHKRRENIRLLCDLLSSQEGLCSMKLSQT
jgi:hypothetical protein